VVSPQERWRPAMTDLKLPEPIAAYFNADRRDGEAVARCFTKQAVIKDEGQTHSGPAAIKAWQIECPPSIRTPANPSPWSRRTAGTSSPPGWPVISRGARSICGSSSDSSAGRSRSWRSRHEL